MKCPNCGEEMTALEVKTVFGIRGNVIDKLIDEEVRITTCCGVAFISTIPKTEELIVPEEKKIITEI